MKLISGYGLIELCYGLAIAIITISLGIPSFNHVLAQERTITTVNRLVSLLNYARLSAIKYHQVVTLCASHDHQTCSSNWQGDFMVFIDENAAGKVSSQDKLLKIWQLPTSQGTFTWQASQPFLSMQATGISTGNAGAFYYCPTPHTEYARAIIINLMGRVKVVDKRGEPRLRCNFNNN